MRNIFDDDYQLDFKKNVTLSMNDKKTKVLVHDDVSNELAATWTPNAGLLVEKNSKSFLAKLDVEQADENELSVVADSCQTYWNKSHKAVGTATIGNRKSA